MPGLLAFGPARSAGAPGEPPAPDTPAAAHRFRPSSSAGGAHPPARARQALAAPPPTPGVRSGNVGGANSKLRGRHGTRTASSNVCPLSTKQVLDPHCVLSSLRCGGGGRVPRAAGKWTSWSEETGTAGAAALSTLLEEGAPRARGRGAGQSARAVPSCRRLLGPPTCQSLLVKLRRPGSPAFTGTCSKGFGASTPAQRAWTPGLHAESILCVRLHGAGVRGRDREGPFGHAALLPGAL